MKAVLSISVFFILWCSSVAQVTFLKKYYLSSGVLRSGAPLSNGHYALGYDEWDDNRRAVIFTTDAFGEVVWARQVVSDEQSTVHGLVVSAEDEIYAFISKGPQLPAESKMIVVKFDGQGQKIWDIYVGENFNNSQNITTTSDGHLLATNNLPSNNFRCLKINKDGQIVWAKYFTAGAIASIKQLAEDTDGNYWLLGNGKNPQSLNEFITHLLKISSNGEILFSRSYNFPNPVSLDIFSDNKMVITGFVPNDPREFIMLLEANGEIIWANSMENALNVAGAYADSDDHLIISGGYAGPGTVALMRMDTTGHIEWGHGYSGGFTGFRQSFETPDGYAVLGRIVVNNNVGGLFFKTDPDGLIAGCDYFNICPQKEPLLIDTFNFSWTSFDYSIDTGYAVSFQPAILSSGFFCEPSGAPSAIFHIPDTICQNSCIELDSLAQSNAISWEWYFENGQPSSSFQQNPGRICYNETGLFDIWHIIQFAGCSDTFSTQLAVVPFPEINLGNDTVLCKEEVFVLNGNIKGANGYRWDDGSTLPTRKISISGIYHINAFLSHCVRSDSIYVDFQNCNDPVYAPTAFSPNDDGINDFFEIFTDGAVILSVKIFNRWGGVVYEAQAPPFSWDGRFKGKPANSGIYVYLIKYRSEITNATKTKSGDLLLIR